MSRYCVGPAMAIDWGEDPPARWDRRLVRRVAGYFRPYWRQGGVAIACLAVQAVLGLVPALVTKALIDSLTRPGPGERFSHVALLVAAGVAAALAGGLVGVAESWYSTQISQGIMFDLRGRLFARLLSQSVGFFTASRTGEVLSRIDNDVGGIQDVVSDTVLGLVANAIVLPTTLAVMVALNWRLTVVALVLLPLTIVPTRRAGQRTYQARKRTQEQLGRIGAYLQEILSISGILLVKAFTTQRSERARFGALNAELRRRVIRQEMIARWFGMLLDTLRSGGPALLWLFGGWLILRHEGTVSTVVTFLAVLLPRLYGAVGQLGNLHVNVMGSLALFHRLFQVLDLPIEVADAPGARPLDPQRARGAVAFEQVTFAYRPELRAALDRVSFQVEPGQLVALVGPTGAGKTTVTALLARFYDPQAGRVLLDGHELRELTLESLGSQLGIVFQDTFLFHASIADNLRYARPDASDGDLVAAACAAQLHEFIRSLPDGYDTVVGERGHRLSGGEKQRVAIARVLLKDPRVLVLDEATSHLDTVSEHLIQAALRPLLAGRTSLVIAHRLSTILAADRILVLDQGRLVEQGSHAELLRHDGLYTRLYQRQFLTQTQSQAQAGPAATEALAQPSP